MARFTDLSEQERINKIKETFTELLTKLSEDHNKINDYVNLDKPKEIVPSLLTIKEDASEEERISIEAKNKALVEETAKQNAELVESFKKREEEHAVIKKTVSTLKKLEGCVCGSCLSVDITSEPLPPELDIIIDAARKEAEAKTYQQ